VFGCEQHGRPIVGAQETDTFFGDFGEFEERYHLETGVGVSYGAFVPQVGGLTHPPLSAAVSTSVFPSLYAVAWCTCEDIVWPGLELMRAAYGIECRLSWLKASPACQQWLAWWQNVGRTGDMCCLDIAGSPGLRVGRA